ncbi:MAG: gamma-glutamyltransferase [Alphaproteobacteria bacterium]|nr:gamma-glutamyltransferase [Alphaproteobacteria bacterium]
MIFYRLFIILGVFCLFGTGASAPSYSREPTPARESSDQIAPESATGIQETKAVQGKQFMVATAHPLATQAGFDILSRGGTAADAAIAVQLVLGLVEPQSSGIGGGGFVLYYDAKTGKLTSFDGRETAPRLAGRHMFIGEDGKPLPFYKAAVGARAVGVPGIPALMETLHKSHGRLPWRDLFSPAITLAETGFAVSPRLSALAQADRQRLKHHVDTQLYFMPDSSTPLPEGHWLQNGLYAQTLRDMALNGTQSFYKGEIAQKISRIVQDDTRNPGLITPEDMAAYRVKERAPVCGAYRAYKICSMGEPSSGGLTLLSALGILNHFDLPSWGPDNVMSWHVIGEASRLAFADRNYYMADSDFVKTPGINLIDPAYLAARAKLISGDKVISDVLPGTPPGWVEETPTSADRSVTPPGTTHISIVDGYGNIVSMTSSIENAFGSRLMVDGFLLNNQLTDFSFEPDHQGKRVANHVQGGKRPRSSMTPVIVFDSANKPILVIGSAGGSAIIGYVLSRIISILDWHMDVNTALRVSNVIHRGTGFEMEDTASAMGDQLNAKGHPVEYKDLNSGLTAIDLRSGLYTGAVDPRREGTAKGY